MNCDCDFIIATTTLPIGRAEAELRRLHEEIPTRPGFWTGHLEGCTRTWRHCGPSTGSASGGCSAITATAS
jgi:hypothetical protein